MFDVAAGAFADIARGMCLPAPVAAQAARAMAPIACVAVEITRAATTFTRAAVTAALGYADVG